VTDLDIKPADILPLHLPKGCYMENKSKPKIKGRKAPWIVYRTWLGYPLYRLPIAMPFGRIGQSLITARSQHHA
jgi:hypothetical protein